MSCLAIPPSHFGEHCIQCVYEALADAGFDRSSLMRKPFGVFAGCMSSTNSDLGGLKAPEPGEVSGFSASSLALSIVANRISYGQGGPSIIGSNHRRQSITLQAELFPVVILDMDGNSN